MICAVHQPNFFAWLPYFQKVRQADVFVILSEAQFSRDYYQHRFNIGDAWYTMPHVHGNIPIKDKQYHNPLQGWAAIKRRLPQYDSVLRMFDGYISESLLKTNTAIITRICELLGVPTAKIVMDYPTALTSNERLIDICKHFGCDTYLSGTGAKAYINEVQYSDAGIKLIYQNVKDEDKRPILTVLGDICRVA